MQTCLSPLPDVSSKEETAGGALKNWPDRLKATPPRISMGTIKGVTPETFSNDNKLWKKRVSYYKNVNNQLGKAGRYRNLLDMNAYLGGFAAALIDSPVWVMNVVPVQAKVDTLGAIFERGLIGTYHNWLAQFSFNLYLMKFIPFFFLCKNVCGHYNVAGVKQCLLILELMT